jgi:NTE family protein
VKRALVLAGGGVAGIAWELGVLLGVRDRAPDLTAADVLVGTSAGSSVAAQISSGTDLAALFDAQLSEESAEIEVDLDLEALMASFGEAAAGAASAQEIRQRIGALALATETVDEPVRRRAVAARLPAEVWPDRRMLLPSVDAETGELVVFTRESGVGLIDAVAASCAVPGVWPPATINGRRYIDGGTRSVTNADLAEGCDRILVITPSPAGQPPTMDRLPDEIERLRPAAVLVVYADEASQASFGDNPLSPTARKPAALAGRTVGRARAGEIARFWT